MPRKARQEDSAQVYRDAADEHKTLAYELYEARRYVMAYYVAGLAVECILRAYRYRIDPVFDARHNLEALYVASGFGTIVLPEDEVEISSAFGEVVRRWSSSHRFRSEQALRLVLRRANVGRKGKYVRESSRQIVRAATVVVDLGVTRWKV